MSILIFRFNVGLVAWCVQTVPPHGIDLWFWSLCVNVYFGGLGLTLKVLNLVVCVTVCVCVLSDFKVSEGCFRSGIKRHQASKRPGRTRIRRLALVGFLGVYEWRNHLPDLRTRGCWFRGGKLKWTPFKNVNRQCAQLVNPILHAWKCVFVQVIGTNYSICPNFENDVCVTDLWKDVSP